MGVIHECGKKVIGELPFVRGHRLYVEAYEILTEEEKDEERGEAFPIGGMVGIPLYQIGMHWDMGDGKSAICIDTAIPYELVATIKFLNLADILDEYELRGKLWGARQRGENNRADN